MVVLEVVAQPPHEKDREALGRKSFPGFAPAGASYLFRFVACRTSGCRPLRNPPMQYLFALMMALLFLAATTRSIAGCSEHHYETVCEEDPDCHWESKQSKCKQKRTGGIHCKSHTELLQTEWVLLGPGKGDVHRNKAASVVLNVVKH
jgi:hypothetical protein